jgi:hypothetical protein
MRGSSRHGRGGDGATVGQQGARDGARRRPRRRALAPALLRDGEPVAPEREADHQRGDPEPQRAVREQQALERHDPFVALGDRPVFGQARHRDAAERVDQRRQRLVLHRPDERVRREPADQQHDAADVHRQHPARQRARGRRTARPARRRWATGS